LKGVQKVCHKDPSPLLLTFTRLVHASIENGGDKASKRYHVQDGIE
jgi:hypothetical protein